MVDCTGHGTWPSDGTWYPDPGAEDLRAMPTPSPAPIITPSVVRDGAGPRRRCSCPERNAHSPTSLGLSFGNSANSGPFSLGDSREAGSAQLGGGGGGGILGCHCGSVPQMGHLSVRSDEVFCTEGFFQGEKVSPVLVGTQRDVPHPPRSPHWGRTGWDRDKQNGGRMGWQQAG